MSLRAPHHLRKQSVLMFVWLFVCLFVCFFVSFVCLFVCFFVCLLACLFVRSCVRSFVYLFVCLLVMSWNFAWLVFLVADRSCSGRRSKGEAKSLLFSNFQRVQTRTANAFDDDPTLSGFLSIHSPAKNDSVRSLISSPKYLNPLSANDTSSWSASFLNSMSSLTFRDRSSFVSWSYIFSRCSSHA